MPRLTSEETALIFRQVKTYLAEHPSINNRTLRSLTKISYDQAIAFFNLMVEEGKLLRTGTGSGIKYTLPSA